MNGGLIIVEGNIGAGKSTFAKKLAERLGGKYFAEPDEKTNYYLEDYYKEAGGEIMPAGYAFKMQIHLLSRRRRAQIHAQSQIRDLGRGFIVMDRSYYGDVCFANVQRQIGLFDARDYDTYIRLHTDMKVQLEPPAMAIFLEATPEVCKARITKRMSENAGRKIESGIDLGYLEKLNVEISKLADSLEGKTIVKRLDWNDDKCPLEIQARCNEIAVELMLRKQSVYDFWTGTNGIGDGYSDESNLDGLAAREALV